MKLRLTIDLDKRKSLRKILIKINSFFNAKIIDEIWVSASKRGYHLISYGIKADYDIMFLMRQIFGDDKWRIKIDMLKRKYTGNGLDVLWTQKGKKKAIKIYDKFNKINKLPVCYKRYVE
jgi:hypothetical protein